MAMATWPGSRKLRILRACEVPGLKQNTVSDGAQLSLSSLDNKNLLTAVLQERLLVERPVWDFGPLVTPGIPLVSEDHDSIVASASTQISACM